MQIGFSHAMNEQSLENRQNLWPPRGAFFCFSILRGRWAGHLQEVLAKFGYRSDKEGSRKCKKIITNPSKNTRHIYNSLMKKINQTYLRAGSPT